MVKPGYKQTEIGEIPEDWGMAEAAQLMRIETGSKNTEDKIDDGRFPFFVRSPQVERINSYHYDCEAVLTAGDGVGTGKTFHYYNGKFDAHQRVYVMSQFNGIHAKFFYYYFSENFGSEVAKYTAKSSVDSVRRPMIAEMNIPLPAIREQQRIAEALSDVDALIASLEKLIAKKKAIKQGAMQRLLTGKTRLPGFGGEWKLYSMPTILQKQSGIKIGPFGSQLKKEYLLDDGPYKVYGQDNVYKNDFSSGKRYISEERFMQLQSCEIRSGDFLVSTMGTIGKCAIVPELFQSGIMDSHLIRLRINEQIIMTKYLIQLFSDDYGYLASQTDKLSVGGIMDGLSTNIVNSLTVFFPQDLEEQKAIVQILEDLDDEIESLEQKLAKTRQLKQGMMQQLLTGKIRLV